MFNGFQGNDRAGSFSSFIIVNSLSVMSSSPLAFLEPLL
jgi:hypothetical protein